MKFIPAIDLKNKKCVRLERGKEEKETIYNTDPVEQAIFFEKNGCQRIHIVDLDAAFGRKDVNIETIIKIRKAIKIPIQLGGGIKNEEDVNFWINAGIDYLILGSLSVKNSDLVLKISNKYSNKLYVALDILEENIMIRGWLEKSKLSIQNIFNIYNSSQIKGYVLTDVSRDGLLYGLNFNLIKKIIFYSEKNIIVGGGLSNYKDIKILKDKFTQTQVEGFIAGKSIYSGNIDIKTTIDLLKEKNK